MRKRLAAAIASAVLLTGLFAPNADAQWGNPPPPVVPFPNGDDGWHSIGPGFINASQQGDATTGHYRFDGLHAGWASPHPNKNFFAIVDLWVRRDWCNPQWSEGSASTPGILWFGIFQSGYSCRISGGHVWLRYDSLNYWYDAGTIVIDPDGYNNVDPECISLTIVNQTGNGGSDYVRFGTTSGQLMIPSCTP